MKYVDEYRDGRVAGNVVREIERVQTRPWVIMEMFGGQTHSITPYRIVRKNGSLAESVN